MMPKVSVIIPVYNTSEYLGQCLESILMQTLTDIEVICVDDGSTDDSLSCLQGYAFLDGRIKIIHQENAGGGAARNRGLQEATGEYIIFLDSDDFFVPEMLEKMVRQIEETQSDIAVCGHVVFDNSLQQVTQINPIDKKYLRQLSWKPEEIIENLFTFCPPAPWCKMIRASLIRDNNLTFDEHAHADDLMFHCLVLAAAQRITMMPDTPVCYRTNTAVQQSKNKQNAVADIMRTLGRAYERFKQLNWWDTYQISLLNRIRRSLQFELMDCGTRQKRQNLMAVRTNLPEDLYAQVFSSSYPAISIIVPAYNMARYLPECLDSVLNQTLKNIEILCVDDGSTDDTLDILNHYAANDSRIKVIHQENKGLAGARNTALEKATGLFIQCLDADDYLEPDTCECVYTYMTLFGLEMCQIAAIEFNDQTRKEFIDPYHTLDWLPERFSPVFSYQNIRPQLPNIAVTACLTCYRRNFLIKRQIQWLNEKLCYEDTPFFIEAFLKAERVGALPDKFYHRRVHPAAVTQNIATNFGDYLKITDYTLKMILGLKVDEGIFLSYLYTLTTKAWMNFARLAPPIQETLAPGLYDFCLNLLKKYHCPMIPDVRNWCVKYARGLGKKALCTLKWHLFLAKFNRAEYTVNLIEIVRKPDLNVKILGLSVFQVVHSPMELDEEELPLQKKVKKAEEIFYKIFGLTFLKIEKRDLYG